MSEAECKGGTGGAVVGCSLKRRELFRIDLERLSSAFVVKNPNNRQERAQVNDNRYDNEECVRRSALVGGGGYVCEGPLRERKDYAM